LSVATKKPAANSAPAPTDLSSPAAWASEPLRELIASVPDYVLVLDRRLRVLLANRGVGRRSAKELEGLAVTEFFPRDLHPQALAAMHRVLATGQSSCEAANGFAG
jgi:PAS domain-containing protein